MSSRNWTIGGALTGLVLIGSAWQLPWAEWVPYARAEVDARFETLETDLKSAVADLTMLIKCDRWSAELIEKLDIPESERTAADDERIRVLRARVDQHCDRFDD